MVLLVACAGLSGCIFGTTDQPASVWPPADFRLEVEEQRLPADGSGGEPASSRLFQAWADGTALHRQSRGWIGDAQAGVRLPVYSSACCYRLRPEAIRSLSRKTWLRSKGLGMAPEAGFGEDVTGDLSIRFLFVAEGRTVAMVATERVLGTFSLVLNAVNQFVPAGQEFQLPGMVIDPADNVLYEVPQPVDDQRGALELHKELIQGRPGDVQLLLHAFALACALGDRAEAEALLQRYRMVVVDGPLPGEGDPPSSSAEMPPAPRLLEGLLPR